MIMASVGSFILFCLSARAVLYIYTWYPLLVAQSWFIYDEILLVFSFCEVVSGGLAAFFSYTRRSYWWATAFAVLCTVFGGGIWLITLIAPGYRFLWQSILYFFLPHLLPPLVGVILLLGRKNEFKH